MPVPEGLSTLVHFYADEEHLFETVTMRAGKERDRILDDIVSRRGWYWGRFARSERATYMLARETVEQWMRSEFEQNYRNPPCTRPVYFYIYPHLDPGQLRSGLEQRVNFDEHDIKMLSLRLSELPDTKDISFTLEDSFQSYRHVLQRNGIAVRKGRPDAKCMECQGRIFHIDELASVYARHDGEQDIYFEAQLWNPRVLDQIKKHPGVGT